MKYKILIIFILILAGVFLIIRDTISTSPELGDKKEQVDTLKFSEPVTLTPNSSVVFSDGLRVRLKQIDDSRCPEDVECIWAGELVGVFEVSGGNLEKAQVFNLGSARTKSEKVGGYSFSLVSFSVASFTIIVTK